MSPSSPHVAHTRRTCTPRAVLAASTPEAVKASSSGCAKQASRRNCAMPSLLLYIDGVGLYTLSRLANLRHTRRENRPEGQRYVCSRVAAGWVQTISQSHHSYNRPPVVHMG